MKKPSFQNKIQLAGIVCLILILAVSCQHFKKETQDTEIVIKKPFSSVTLPTEQFSLHPALGGTLTCQNGSKIIVAPNSLTDESGQPLKDTCMIKFEQYHDMAEILASGIPMSLNYGEQDMNKAFISAGMFKITGQTKQGNPIKILTNKPIRVELASYQNDAEYAQYLLDQKTGNWIKTQEERKQPNTEKLKLLETIDLLKKKAPFEDKNYFVFDTYELIDAYFKDDRSKIYANRGQLPKALKGYGIAMHQYNPDYQSMACIRGIDYPSNAVVWENVSGKKILKNKGLSPRITGGKHIQDKYYNYYKIWEKDIATLELVNKKEKVVAVYKIKPVMSIRHLLAFSANDWKKKETEVWAKIHQQEERVRLMADIVRSVVVADFGIYNCDRINNESERLSVLATLEWPELTVAPEKLFYISKNKRFMIEYKIQETLTLQLENDPSAQLITVLSNNQIGEVSASELSSLYARKNTQAKLVFKKSKTIKNIQDLKEFLNPAQPVSG